MIPDLPVLVNILLLSLVASMGTGLGGLIAIVRRPGRRSYGLLLVGGKGASQARLAGAALLKIPSVRRPFRLFCISLKA